MFGWFWFSVCSFIFETESHTAQAGLELLTDPPLTSRPPHLAFSLLPLFLFLLSFQLFSKGSIK